MTLSNAQRVVSQLKSFAPRTEFKLLPIRTKADRKSDPAEVRKSGKILFVKEIEQALLKRKIDLAIHDLEEVPLALAEGLTLAAVLQRGDPGDAFVSRDGTPIQKLRPGTVIGTTGLRRQAFLAKYFPHLRVEELKGDLPSQLEILKGKRKIAGILLDTAGLKTLHPHNGIPTQSLPIDKFMPAPGQGTLCIECRERDQETTEFVSKIHHESSGLAARAERELARRLNITDRVPFGAFARTHEEGLNTLLHMTAYLSRPDGTDSIQLDASGSSDDPEGVAGALETFMNSQGAGDLIAELSSARIYSRSR